jgi:hypothetical protein
MTQIPFLECKGKKTDKDGQNCNFCSGRGYNSDHFLKSLEASFKEYVDRSLPAAFEKI